MAKTSVDEKVQVVERTACCGGRLISGSCSMCQKPAHVVMVAIDDARCVTEYERSNSKMGIPTKELPVYLPATVRGSSEQFASSGGHRYGCGPHTSLAGTGNFD